MLHVVAAARQKNTSLVDQRRVVFAADPTDAWGAAPLDLVQQARAGADSEGAVAAGPQQERLLQRHQCPIYRAGGGERAEITAFLVSCSAVLGELREVVTGGQLDERKRLVVPQQHVVAGHQPLDHVAFEQQCLGFGVGDDDLDDSGLGHHAPQPVRQPGGMRVVLNPTL